MMQHLLDALKSYDLELLQIIANRWDVDIHPKDNTKAAEQLATAMLDQGRASMEWERLKDDERGALQMLITAPNNKTPRAQYERLYGEIRQMGPEKRQREKPYLSPQGQAEVLYYRGFLHITFDEGKAGLKPFVYIPADLAAMLPTHQVGYDLSKASEEELPGEPTFDTAMPMMMTGLALEEDPLHIIKADTSIIDDVATLLAYVQMTPVFWENGYIPLENQQAVMQSFVGPKTDPRMSFILFLLGEMHLLELAETTGRLEPNRSHVKKWLDAPRTLQIKALVDAWQNSTVYNELWQVPTLQPENAGTQNDPRVLRNTLRDTIQLMVPDDWVSIDGIIQEIKESDPDFQRPGGDYSSWYIRDRATGDYLHGFETWDHVEGAMLRFALLRPMYWLAMLDLGSHNPADDNTQASAFKLTAFGRAWINRVPWPEVRDPEGNVKVFPDGKIEVSRAISRYERFQLARFTQWESAGDVFIYRLTPQSVQQAASQGITVQHIRAFLQRINNGHAIPDQLEESLKRWEGKSDSSTARIEHLMILQVEDTETLQMLWENPDTRRYFGRLLGPKVVAVREDQAQDLIQALQDQGIPIENLL